MYSCNILFTKGIKYFCEVSTQKASPFTSLQSPVTRLEGPNVILCTSLSKPYISVVCFPHPTTHILKKLIFLCYILHLMQLWFIAVLFNSCSVQLLDPFDLTVIFLTISWFLKHG